MKLTKIVVGCDLSPSSDEALERAVAIAKDHGAKRALLLPVSAPFHCAMMRPAAAAMEEALADVAIRAPLVPVYANVTAAPVGDPDTIRTLLIEQVTGMVRWRESVARRWPAPASPILSSLAARCWAAW